MKLGLGELLRIPDAKVLNKELFINKSFTGVSIDSRKCKKNDLFFAIKGERYDGHDFVFDVINKCYGVVVSRKWYNSLSAVNKKKLSKKKVVLVNNTTISLGDLASIYRRKFVIPVLAVAGSNGKTTAKDFIAHVLSKKYKVLKTSGNYNNALGVPLTLFRLEKKHNFCVLELGTNHFGEVKYLCKISKPQFGVITNIGKEHLEFFKNIEGVTKAECEVVDYLQTVYGMFFLNADDRYLKANVKKDSINILKYGKSNKNEVTGKLVKYSGFYPEIAIRYGKQYVRVKLNMTGTQGFQLALCAAAIGLYFDVPINKVKRALTEFKVETKRRNELKNIRSVWIIDDTYNSNPDSVIAALDNMKEYKVKGKKHIVLGDMKELGKSSKREHNEIGKLIKKMKFENLYTYGDDSKETFKGAKGIKNNFYFEDKKSLAEMLKRNIKKDDLVLVKGSRSMQMEEIVEAL